MQDISFTIDSKASSWYCLNFWVFKKKSCKLSRYRDMLSHCTCHAFFWLATDYHCLYTHQMSWYDYLNTQSHDMKPLQDLEQKHWIWKPDVSIYNKLPSVSHESCLTITVEPSQWSLWAEVIHKHTRLSEHSVLHRIGIFYQMQTTDENCGYR